MKTKFTILTVVMVASMGLAQENCVTLKYVSTSAGRSIKISTNHGSVFQNVFGGMLKMKVNDGETQNMLCVDPFTIMASGNYCTTQLTTADMGAKGLQVGYLINKYMPTIASETNSTLKNDKALALQLALWEVVAETSTTASLSGGLFRAKAASGSFTTQQQSLINMYLSDTGSGIATYYKSSLDNCHNPVSQSMATAVPEPATMAALAIGLATILRRRKKSK